MMSRTRTSRRGGIYLLVMVGSATVTTIALVGLSLSAERRQAAQRAVNAQAATQLAHASIEMGIHTIATDPSWRWTYGDGWWFKDHWIGDGRLALAVVDRDGGSITDAPCRPVVLRGVGIQGTSRTMLEVELEPEYVWPDDGLTVAQALGAMCYWSLDSGASPVDSISGFSGSWEGGSPSGSAESVSCSVAARFDGVDDFVEIRQQRALELAQGSIAFWFNQSTGQTQSGLFCKDDSVQGKTGGTGLTLSAGGLTFTMRSGGSQYSINGDVPEQGRWHHVVATFGASGMSLFLDGALQGTDPIAISWASNKAWPVVGVDAHGPAISGTDSRSQFLDGSVAHLSIFDRQLSEGEVLTLMDAQRAPSTMRIVPGSWRRVTE